MRGSSRYWLGERHLREAGKARASVKTLHESVKPAVFTHISFAIPRVSAKEQQELAMCWRWDRVSKTFGFAKVADTRSEGSKGVGHGSNPLASPAQGCTGSSFQALGFM